MNEHPDLLNQWRNWNKQGFIPCPDESESAFQERIAFSLHLEEHLVAAAGVDLPFEVNDPKSKEILNEVLPQTENLYGIRPEWVPLFFSNYQLAPWHGGCAWIFQLDEKTPTSAFLQLRARFRESLTFLGIYHRNELIAHEAAHVGRMLYQEPQYEEIFAYQSSSSSWRRWLGPIVQSSRESFIFIMLLGLAILTDLALLSLGGKLEAIAWGVKLLPVACILLALGRLMRRHRSYKRCLKNLEGMLPEDKDKARHLLYRLRDREIKEFSQLPPEKIKEFIDQAASNSFRWRFLREIYLESDA